MDAELLKSAQKGLRIADIALRAARITLADGFEPKFDSGATAAQFMQRTSRSEVLELENGDQARRLFRVFVDVGVRWIRAPRESEPSQRAVERKKADQEVLALIEATFIAEYDLLEEIAPEALGEFALQNAPWHVWPFWREFVASQCARLNLAKVAMPLQCLPSTPKPNEAHK